MQLVIELGSAISSAGGPGCISVPGWSVVIVATLLTAPRLVKEFRTPRQG